MKFLYQFNSLARKRTSSQFFFFPPFFSEPFVCLVWLHFSPLDPAWASVRRAQLIQALPAAWTSPGRNQIKLSSSDFLAVKTLPLLIRDLKHNGKKMLTCVQGDLDKGKRNKLSLHDSVREQEKGEKEGRRQHWLRAVMNENSWVGKVRGRKASAGHVTSKNSFHPDNPTEGQRLNKHHLLKISKDLSKI